ncbi:hypothetical protein [Amycolatopsis sp. FDAARGOS 1241]|uniref:hypothetical protein n=1 Tax=Amycolatopsis sp. FDAARGOS 1241 TaxID=2778070 RepID=UPI00194DC7CD|nr:hypothetical protein [Amycolatopsis sp. FDAARGOS 1241]QRP45847.1 hypothetical protein I6J71_43365 [Amycolatopsis sp. FDAARGOS 1241]
MRSDPAVLPAAVRRVWGAPAGVAAGATVVFVLVSAHLTDDAYATLSYARNLAFHAHWGLVEQSTANTATSPLHVLVLAAVTVVVRNAVVAAGVVYVGSQVALVLGLKRLAAHAGVPRPFVPLAFAALLVNPLLVSAVGLEVALGAAVAVWVLVFATERRPAALGFAAGALTLVRVDLLVVALVVFAARREFWAGVWRTAFAALAVTVPWFVFSWVVLGSAVPDTVVIDAPTSPLRLWRDFPTATAVSLLALPFAAAGLLWTARRRRESGVAGKLTPFAVLAAAGLVHFVLSNTTAYPWSCAPGIVGSTVFLVAGGCVIPKSLAPQRVAAATAAGLALAAAAAVYAEPGLPRRFAPITGNLAASDEYAVIGPQVAELAKGRAVESTTDAGALAYACDCHVVDEFSDRGAVDPAITETKDRSSDLGRALLEANFHNFDHTVPPTQPDFVLATTCGAPPSTALAAWTVDSPRTGTQHLYLAPAR